MASIRPVGAVAPTADVPVDGLVAMMRDAGTDRFIQSMLDFCKTSVGADFVSIFAHAGEGGPALVGTATATRADNTRRAAEGYRQHYASDVNFGLMSQGRLGTYATYQTAGDIISVAYRRACYDRTGIADRLSHVRISADRSLSVSIYRRRTSGRFSERELARANALMPVLMAAADLHGAPKPGPATVVDTVAAAEHALRSKYPQLTAREREVAARVLAGLSARQIGLTLGIAETTVISHRNNAYARIGVSGLRQLLRLDVGLSSGGARHRSAVG
jgi:DNA-binding CsgD family transcriptional regulator